MDQPASLAEPVGALPDHDQLVPHARRCGVADRVLQGLAGADGLTAALDGLREAEHSGTSLHLLLDLELFEFEGYLFSSGCPVNIPAQQSAVSLRAADRAARPARPSEHDTLFVMRARGRPSVKRDSEQTGPRNYAAW